MILTSSGVSTCGGGAPYISYHTRSHLSPPVDRRTPVSVGTLNSCRHPPCDIGGVLRKVLMRILFTRQKSGPSARIVMSKLDVKEAFRHVLVDPARAAYFGYVFGNMTMVDLCLEFRWHGSPSFWGLLAAGLEHAHDNTSYFTHAVTDIGCRDA